MDLNEKIDREMAIYEVVYHGNLAFEEMVKFYQVAKDSDIKKMENFIKKNSFNAVKKLLNKVLSISLKGNI